MNTGQLILFQLIVKLPFSDHILQLSGGSHHPTHCHCIIIFHDFNCTPSQATEVIATQKTRSLIAIIIYLDFNLQPEKPLTTLKTAKQERSQQEQTLVSLFLFFPHCHVNPFSDLT